MTCKLFSEFSILPSKGSEYAAGFDLHACLKESTKVLMPHTRDTISTGVAITPPRGHYGRVAPRSGLARDYGIDVLAGVIDEDYTGEIKVILYNTGDLPLVIENGMKSLRLFSNHTLIYQDY